MEIFRILLLTFIGIILHDAYANECGNFQISLGTLTTPGYPEVEDGYSCTAYLPFQTGGGIHATTVADIKLYYTNWLGHKKCTMSFRVGEYNAPCESTKKECIVYYNNERCKEIIISSYPNCKSYKTLHDKVEVTVTSNGDWAWWFGYRHSKGVKMKYEYVSCPSEISTMLSSTTTTAVTSTTITIIQRTTTAIATTKAASTTPSTAAILFSATTEELTTKSSEQKRQSTIQEISTKQSWSNSTSPEHGSSNQNSMTIIVAAVCSLLILILILAIVTVLVLRKRKMAKAASTGENVHPDAEEIGTAETVYSAAYANFEQDQSNPSNQDNLYSFAAADQSEIATYSTLDHEFGQSNRRNQDTVQSENENAYSFLNHDQQINQSNHDLTPTAGPQEVEMYSTIGKEPEVTVRYKVQPTVDVDESTIHEMVENVLYGAR